MPKAKQSHTHEWEKKEELIRRTFNKNQENKLYKYNQMFPGNYQKPMSATLTVHVCKDESCGARQVIDYKVNV